MDSFKYCAFDRLGECDHTCDLTSDITITGPVGTMAVAGLSVRSLDSF